MQPYGSAMRGIIANVNRYIGQQLKDYHLQWGQFEYFLFICEHAGINQNELAQLKNVGKASVTKAVKILEGDQLIERRSDPDDRRSYRCYVTKKGQAIIDDLLFINRDVEAELFKGFDEADKHRLLKYLQCLYKNAIALNEPLAETSD